MDTPRARNSLKTCQEKIEDGHCLAAILDFGFLSPPLHTDFTVGPNSSLENYTLRNKKAAMVFDHCQHTNFMTTDQNRYQQPQERECVTFHLRGPIPCLVCQHDE
jgi:hypothetical protein